MGRWLRLFLEHFVHKNDRHQGQQSGRILAVARVLHRQPVVDGQGEELLAQPSPAQPTLCARTMGIWVSPFTRRSSSWSTRPGLAQCGVVGQGHVELAAVVKQLLLETNPHAVVSVEHSTEGSKGRDPAELPAPSTLKQGRSVRSCWRLQRCRSVPCRIGSCVALTLAGCCKAQRRSAPCSCPAGCAMIGGALEPRQCAGPERKPGRRHEVSRNPPHRPDRRASARGRSCRLTPTSPRAGF
jgi:hypothetical protein